MSLLADVCRFTPTAGGTTDWTYSSAVTGYQSPTAAGLVNGGLYSLRAESADLSQWELSVGTYNSGTGVFARTRVLFNSAGTTAKISFTAAPQVAVVGLAEDLATPANVRGHLGGLGTLWASTTTITVNPGAATDSTNAEFIALAGAMTKSTSAWATGTGSGGLDTGTIAASTWYFFYVIKNPSNGTVDVLFSLSTSAPTLPSGYTFFRRIGAAKTNASSQWVKFFQDGDRFTWDVPSADVNATNPGTAAVLRTLNVPLGIRVRACVMVVVQTTTANTDATAAVYISDPGVTDSTPSPTIASIEAYFPIVATTATGGVAEVYTNTSSQVRSRLQISGAGSVLTMGTLAWTDTRGKDA